jgi:predicted double-glycine peptidase
MRLGKRRFSALFGLFGFAVLVVGFQALPLSIPHLREHRDWIKTARAKMRGASFAGETGTVLQARGNDCGAACLKMVLAAHGIERSLSDLTLELRTTPRGTSMLDLRLVAGRQGLPARSWAIRDTDLSKIPLPAIAFINGDHFVVIRRFAAEDVLEVDDPALGRLQWPIRSFKKEWPGQALVFDLSWTPS